MILVVCPSVLETAMSLPDTVEAEVRGYTPMSEYNHTMEVCVIILRFLHSNAITDKNLFYWAVSGSL